MSKQGKLSKKLSVPHTPPQIRLIFFYKEMLYHLCLFISPSFLMYTFYLNAFGLMLVIPIILSFAGSFILKPNTILPPSARFLALSSLNCQQTDISKPI